MLRNNYGFKSMQCHPLIKELSAFEKDLLELIKKAKLKRNLKEDIKKIKSIPETLRNKDSQGQGSTRLFYKRLFST